MIRAVVRLIGVLGFGALLAQAGHLLVYQIEFGGAAQAVQSQGAHAYFPALAKSGLGLLAVALIAALLLIGIARLLPGRPVVMTGRGPAYVSLLSILFTVQVVCFMAQETIESAAAHQVVPSVLSLVLLGCAGQFPVAALAALAMKWLSVRVDVALLTLGAELAVRFAQAAPVALVIPLPELVAVPVLTEACPSVYIKRGPPAILRA